MNLHGIKGEPELPTTLEKHPRSYSCDSHSTLMLEANWSHLTWFSPMLLLQRSPFKHYCAFLGSSLLYQDQRMSCLLPPGATKHWPSPHQRDHIPLWTLQGLHIAFRIAGPYNLSSKQGHLRAKGGIITNDMGTTDKATLGNWNMRSSYCRIDKSNPFFNTAWIQDSLELPF